MLDRRGAVRCDPSGKRSQFSLEEGCDRSVELFVKRGAVEPQRIIADLRRAKEAAEHLSPEGLVAQVTTTIHHITCGVLHAPPRPRASCHCLLLQSGNALALVDTGIGWLTSPRRSNASGNR